MKGAYAGSAACKQDLIEEGYITIFIFTKPNLGLIEEEMKTINNGYFLFLNNINSVDLATTNVNKIFNIKRVFEAKYNSTTFIAANTEKWITFDFNDKKKVSNAFKVDKNNRLIASSSEDAVFHCYSPTLEENCFSFKMSSDFSTDLMFDNMLLSMI